MSRRKEIIVIGAGVGGLTAAAILSKAGLAVEVHEAQPRPGGYLSGFSRRGFSFDTAIIWLNQFGPGGLGHRILSSIGDDFPQCEKLRCFRRYKGQSFDRLLTSNPDELKTQLLADYPDESKGIRRFFRDAKALGERWMALGSRGRSPDTMPLVERSLRGGKMLVWALPVMKHLTASAEEGLRRYFRGREIQKIFCTEERFISVILPIAWAYANDFQIPPTGGSEKIIEWLIDQIELSGSRVILRSRVDRVLVERRRAIGVALEDGDRLFCRYVVAGSDVGTLYEKLLPLRVISQKLKKKLNHADLYQSHFTVFLGLDVDPAVLGLGSGGEMVCLTRDDVPRTEQSGGDPHRSALTVLSPSVRDPSLAPRGKGTLTIQCTALFDYGDRWKSGVGLERGHEYRTFKQNFADILIERVEAALLPSLRHHIEVMEIATPLTYHRYTGNRRGSIMGTMPSSYNIRNGLAHLQSPVDRLLLAGHWADYGGGLPIAMKAAANTSLLILRELAPEAYRALRHRLDVQS